MSNGRHPPAKSIKRPKWVDISDNEEEFKVKKKKRHFAPRNEHALQEQRRQLPIASGREALIEEIRKNDVTVIIGETGSGKTTQMPQYILESGLAGNGMIAVTQPRRVAATSLASRVALEQGTSVGKLVGYSVRFDERASQETRIKYMTDGMITRELLGDKLLSKYSVVIVDEAHERTLRTDLLLSSLKRIQKERNSPRVVNAEDGSGKGKGSGPTNPLKIVIMSATLDAEKFSKFYHNAKILYVKGRQHPVKIYHCSESQNDFLEAALRTFFQVHTDQPPGDVLIFLPGQEDIESLEKSIHLFAKRLPTDKMEVITCTMFAAQAPGQNARAFHPTPPNTRKCILATNIAETSITIPGVKYVIDTGKCKEKRYLARDTGGGLDALLTIDITRSSAMQRAGRAGREGPGVCFRLYTEDSFNKMSLSSQPEILRVSLTSSILQLKCLGEDLEDIDLMDKPDLDSIISAYKTLFLLQAFDRTKQLTPIGHQLASFPLEPHHARIILASKENGCTKEILDIISILSCTSRLFQDGTGSSTGGNGGDGSTEGGREAVAEARRKFWSRSGDHVTILNVVNAYWEIALANGGGGADANADANANVNGHGNGATDAPTKLHFKNRHLHPHHNLAPKAERREWCNKHFLNERALLEARDIREQLRGVCDRLGIDWRVSCRAGKGGGGSEGGSRLGLGLGAGAGGDEDDPILKSLACGLVQNSAFLQPDGTYKQVFGRSAVKIHPGSVMHGKKVDAIIYDELIYTNQIYARGVSYISKGFFLSLGALNQRQA
ncbi:hypothetical protein AX16_006115 [Volvariella volvacea WC 439]|nr:hypothetical protein AX16_006115 [Volvariella volvacea WC 439]